MVIYDPAPELVKALEKDLDAARRELEKSSKKVSSTPLDVVENTAS